MATGDAARERLCFRSISSFMSRMADGSRLVLFDLDGTLMRTRGAGVRAMTRAGRQHFGAEFSLDGMVIAGGLDPNLYDEAARRVGVEDPARHHDGFRDLYLQLLEEELAASPEHVLPLPGIPVLLDLLEELDVAMVGLATGNYRRGAILKLEAAGLDPDRFRVQAFGDDATDRVAMIGVGLERFGLACGNGDEVRASNVVVVGDTPKDVECARGNGCRSLAVATGGYTLEALRGTDADVVVPDLTDPEPLLRLLD